MMELTKEQEKVTNQTDLFYVYKIGNEYKCWAKYHNLLPKGRIKRDEFKVAEEYWCFTSEHESIVRLNEFNGVNDYNIIVEYDLIYHERNNEKKRLYNVEDYLGNSYNEKQLIHVLRRWFKSPKGTFSISKKGVNYRYMKEYKYYENNYLN